MYGDWVSTPTSIEYFPADGSGSSTINIETIKTLDVPTYNKYISRKVTYDNTSNQLKDLKTDDNVYDTVNAFRLLRIVLQGRLNLYEYTNKNARQYFFIESKDGEFATLENKKYLESTYLKEVTKYKQQLSYFMKDCSKVADKIAHVKYEEAALKEILNLYFNCSLTKATYQTRKPVKLQMYAFGGVNYSQLKFEGPNSLLSMADFGNNLNYNAMIEFLFTGFQKFEKHQFAIEFCLKNYAFKSDLSYYNVSLTGSVLEKYTFDFGFTYFRANAGYRFSFIKKPAYSLFVDLGYNLGLLLRQNTSYIKNGISYPAYFDASSLDGGYCFGIGTGLHKLSILGRFERAGGVSPFIGVKSPIVSFNLYAGYRIF